MLTISKLNTPLIGPLDLTLDKGTCTTISGPSGAGKSLFLRAIADLDESSGDVALNGTARSSVPAPDWRRQVGYVPAESGWWAERVEDHVQAGPDLEKLLDAIGLAEALQWEISRLSTGERQRLALVRALQLNPKVLLLDEPTSALDPPSVARVEQLLLEWIGKGMAVLLITHDPGQPQRLNARHLHMEKGQLFEGTAREAAS